jgi:ABC-type multidrug transport system ATPase subunit
VVWLEDFLLDYEGTVLVVSHDRYFLNTVCTHIVDIDYGKIRMYVGNYDFWFESSQLIQKLIRDQNKKAEQKIAELQSFIARFAANKSKSRQATSRKKLLEKLTVEELPASSRRYPWVALRRSGNRQGQALRHRRLQDRGRREASGQGQFYLGREDKLAIVGRNENAVTCLFQILAGEMEPDSGTVKWGVSTTQAYFPKDHNRYFENCELSLMDWMRQFSEDKRESYLRTFLGRMLFSGDEVYKPVKVLSGGEKVRCMLSKMMLSGANVLLFDQPTNHLDLESIAALNNGMEAFPHNILFSSHDHPAHPDGGQPHPGYTGGRQRHRPPHELRRVYAPLQPGGHGAKRLERLRGRSLFVLLQPRCLFALRSLLQEGLDVRHLRPDGLRRGAAGHAPRRHAVFQPDSLVYALLKQVGAAPKLLQRQLFQRLSPLDAVAYQLPTTV